MSTINNELVLFVVRNAKGQYFRAKGFSGSGESLPLYHKIRNYD